MIDDSIGILLLEQSYPKEETQDDKQLQGPTRSLSKLVRSTCVRHPPCSMTPSWLTRLALPAFVGLIAFILRLTDPVHLH